MVNFTNGQLVALIYIHLLIMFVPALAALAYESWNERLDRNKAQSGNEPEVRPFIRPVTKPDYPHAA